MRMLFHAALAVGLMGSFGCAKPLQLGSETSFDGLVRVENPRASLAWVDPHFDLSPYDKVMFEDAGIEFSLERRTSRSGVSRGGRREFAVRPAARERLKNILNEAFLRELGRSERFELVDEPGPDVLLAWVGLLDVVSFVPPERSAREDVYLSRVGEATLVIELRDSESHMTLVRIMDRRAAERSGGNISNATSNSAEARRLAGHWARLFRRRLDEAPLLHEQLFGAGGGEGPR